MLKVIVLSGFLGAGKTTLVKHILTNSQDKKVAVLLNDVSQMDIDVDLIKNSQINVKKHKDIVQMSNGCICCTLKDDMVKQVKKIAKTKKYQYLVIEATGVSTPLPVAQAFCYTPGIQSFTELYAMITVIDAQHFEQNIISNQLANGQQKQQSSSRKRRKRKIKQEEQEQAPTLAQLMIDQLEVADLVLINKSDLVNKQQKNSLVGYIKGLSPQSQIYFTQHSNIDLDIVLKKRFNLQNAQICQKWIGQRQKSQDIPETIKYNITSFIYKNRIPFHPEKFHSLITDSQWWGFWGRVTRAKGYFWLANYSRYQFSLHKAGSKLIYAIQHPWFSQMPKKQWAETALQRKNLKELVDKYWQKPNGDKRNQIVFIGKDLPKQEIIKTLNQCLINIQDLPHHDKIFSTVNDPFKGQWNDAIKHFKQSMFENDDQWQQVQDSDQNNQQDQQQMDIEEQQEKTNERNSKKKKQ